MGDVSLQMIRRWICPSLPDVVASRAEHLFESEDAIELVAQVWRLKKGVLLQIGAVR
jgi:hypothetical protein